MYNTLKDVCELDSVSGTAFDNIAREHSLADMAALKAIFDIITGDS